MTRQRAGALVVSTFAALGFVFLLVPIAYTVLFSFNDAGKTNYGWRGFTLDAWQNPCGAPRVCAALAGSLQVGLVSTVLATALGTLLAVGLARARVRGRGVVNLLVFLPMATPEVVLAAALVSQFLSLRLPLGLGTVVVAHTMFCLSFVVVAVKARVATLDPALEQAAADLYATPWQAFWRVTFPLLLPGIGAAALLAFSLSFDDFIVTSFTSGGFVTFPEFVYVSATRGIPPQANVISSAMFVLGLLVVLLSWVVRRLRRR